MSLVITGASGHLGRLVTAELQGEDLILLTRTPDALDVPGADVRHFDWDRPSTWTGVLDRSPCGTGTCARMATLHARGRLGMGQPFVHEGILGTTWTGRLLGETQVGEFSAVVPELTGAAWITGMASQWFYCCSVGL